MVLAITVQASFAWASEPREWTAASGKNKRTATFQRLENDKVYLTLPNGKEVTVRFAQLSVADQDYVRNASQAKQKDPTHSQEPDNAVEKHTLPLMQLPADLNSLQALTLPQAKVLAVRKETLSLNGLLSISADIASVLGGHEGGMLILNGLEVLGPEEAASLAKHRGVLSLDGLRSLDEATAEALSEHSDTLFLNALDVLPANVAARLAKHKGDINLNGVTDLPLESAEALAKHAGALSFNGLRALSDQCATALVKHAGHISLGVLSELSDAAAATFEERRKALSVFYPDQKQRKRNAELLPKPPVYPPTIEIEGNNGSEPPIVADAAKSPSGAVAKSSGLTQGPKDQEAPHEKGKLSAEEAVRLAQRDAPLDLRRLTTISDDAAKALAQHRGLLCLDGLTALSNGGAKALAEHRGSMSFDGLTALPVDVAGALSQCKGTLSFGGLTQVTEDAAFMLSKCKGVSLRLDGVTTLSAGAAKALSQYRGSMSLNGLTTLSDEAAIALGQFRGISLSLKRLTTLPDEAATRLSQHTDATIFLDGITTLSSKAAAALKSHPYASLPDKFAIQPEMPAGPAPASVALQRQNTDAVPQRPNPWVDSIAKNPELNARIVLTIGTVLGPSTDTFPGDSFKGVRLGDAYDTTTIPENDRIVCDWPAPAPAANQANGRDAEVTVLVAKDTGKIVGISAYYQESFQEMVGDVVAAFGKTTQKPETFRVFAGEFPITITIVKYTCPKTIVRVISREGPQGSLGVSINVFDKELVLESLRRYANSVAVSCDWLAAAVEGIADPDKPLGQISPLADCAADVDARSRVLLWFDEQQREGYRRGHKAEDFGPYVPRAFDVAGAFTTADTAAAMADTMVSGSLGVPYLCSRGVDPQGLQCTIASTAVADMFWDVASNLAQSRFPPAEKNISVIRPHPDSPEGLAASMANRSANVISSVDPDASPAERMQLFDKRVLGDRYEWMDKNGYRVRVGSNLAISVEKPLQSPRRGL